MISVNNLKLNLAVLQTVFWGLLFSLQCFAQSERKSVRAGNKQYETGKYANAEIDYRKALEKNKSSYAGTYNLGDALYKQKKYEEAVQQFNNSANMSKNKKDMANSYHNLGNALLEAKKYEQSVDAFKNSLKLNPTDNDTRYNLAYAQSMLKQQQQQQQQNQDKKDDKNKQDKQQQSKQDQNKENQEKKENEQQQNQEKQDQKNQQEKQQPPPKISKEDAERILQALKNNEKDLQKRNAKKEGSKIRIDKQW